MSSNNVHGHTHTQLTFNSCTLAEYSDTLYTK